MSSSESKDEKDKERKTNSTWMLENRDLYHKKLEEWLEACSKVIDSRANLNKTIEHRIGSFFSSKYSAKDQEILKMLRDIKMTIESLQRRQNGIPDIAPGGIQYLMYTVEEEIEKIPKREGNEFKTANAIKGSNIEYIHFLQHLKKELISEAILLAPSREKLDALMEVPYSEKEIASVKDSIYAKLRIR